jgi:L-ribulose-5-phosphate 3-epimerase
VKDYSDFSFGLYEKALPDKLGWPDRLSQVKEAGYDFVEISIDESDERIGRLDWDMEKKRALRRAVDESGVRISTMCLSGLQRYPLGSTYPDLRKKGMEMFIKAIDFAADTGIRVVQVAGYDSAYDEESTEETAENFVRNFEAGLKYASKLGMHLAIENIDYSLMNSLETIMKYVKRYQTPYFTTYADVGNMRAVGLDIRREFEAAKGYISAIHVKDVKENVIRRIPFGEGIMDFHEVFQVIRDSGFSGPVLIEMWADDREDAFEAAAAAKRFVTDRMAEAWRE